MSSLQRCFASFLRCLAVGVALSAVLLGGPDAAMPSGGAPSPSVFEVPVGRVALDLGDVDTDQTLGSAFALGLRSGANSCYLEALWKAPAEAGEITFVVKPPPQEGAYLVTLQRTGSIGDALAACVSGVFRNFYHYQDNPKFDPVRGKLRFTPEFVSAPPPPTDAALRAVLDAQYSGAAIVRIVKAELRSLSHDADSSELLRRYSFSVDLEFLADGYETVCSHNGTYKVFTRTPYRSPYAGHSCESQARKVGEHTSDSLGLISRLGLYPSVAKEWELRGFGPMGTRPEPE